MKFVWINDHADIGHYRLQLFDNDQKLQDMYIYDYTNKEIKESDMERRYPRPYAFEVGQAGMKKGFDYDDEYYNHSDENGMHIGGFQGVCTHTLEDVKKWCKNYLAQAYLKDYDRALKSLDKKRKRAEWFENEGFELEKEAEDEWER